MVTTLGYFGFLFGPPIIGFLADAQGLRFALSFVMILFVLMLFMSTKIEE
jgi:MFS family permease